MGEGVKAIVTQWDVWILIEMTTDVCMMLHFVSEIPAQNPFQHTVDQAPFSIVMYLLRLVLRSWFAICK